MHVKYFTNLLASLLLLACIGCSGDEAKYGPPELSPSAAGDKAMEMYDTNSDGAVAEDEFENAPGLRAAKAAFDKDKDGRITSEEVATRVSQWQQSRTGTLSIRAHVRLDGKPINGAKVTFEPEQFLGDNFKAAYGNTNSIGTARLSIPKADRPSPETPQGVNLGLFLVRISFERNGKESIPAKYNTETTLAAHVAYGEMGIETGYVFELKSK